jgi:hypothetical protein
MEISPQYPQCHEDRKVQKMLERIQLKKIAQERDAREGYPADYRLVAASTQSS